MAKKGKFQTGKAAKKRHGFGRFFLGMFIYAVVFLLIAAGGLTVFWKYMEGFENSRPKITVDAYMQSITPEHVCDMSQSVIDSIDHNLESEEACREYLLSSLTEEITCAKKSAECTADRQVYVLRSGSQVIGQFSIVTTQPDRFGFKPWTLEGEAFDLAYLIGQPQSITVPDVLSVSVNGKTLDAGYIAADDIPYAELEDYYGDYDLPHQVTYSFGPLLGEPEVQVTDAKGNSVDPAEITDFSPYFHNCTEEEAQELDDLTERFVKRYIAFTGSANRARIDNYNNLMYCVVPGSDLADRLLNAIDGLYYAQSKGDSVASITTNHQIRLEEGRYLCDISYEVDTTGFNGVVRTQTNAKLMIVRSGDQLLVEALMIY